MKLFLGLVTSVTSKRKNCRSRGIALVGKGEFRSCENPRCNHFFVANCESCQSLQHLDKEFRGCSIQDVFWGILWLQHTDMLLMLESVPTTAWLFLQQGQHLHHHELCNCVINSARFVYSYVADGRSNLIRRVWKSLWGRFSLHDWNPVYVFHRFIDSGDRVFTIARCVRRYIIIRIVTKNSENLNHHIIDANGHILYINYSLNQWYRIDMHIYLWFYLDLHFTIS